MTKTKVMARMLIKNRIPCCQSEGCILHYRFIIFHPHKSLPGAIQKRPSDHIQIRHHKQHQHTNQTRQQK